MVGPPMWWRGKKGGESISRQLYLSYQKKDGNSRDWGKK